MNAFSISPIGVLKEAVGRVRDFFRSARDAARCKRAVVVAGKIGIGVVLTIFGLVFLDKDVLLDLDQIL